ncbi:MAG: hypothetical protein ACO4CT_11550, partial [Planctomycetota bacterium]
GTFIDAEEDWQHIGVLQDLCASCHFVRLNPTAAKLKSLKGFLTGEALSFPYYDSKSLADWVDRTGNRRPADSVGLPRGGAGEDPIRPSVAPTRTGGNRTARRRVTAE